MGCLSSAGRWLACIVVFISAPSYAEDHSDIPEELLVTASRTATPLQQVGASVSVLDRSDIERLGYVRVQDILRTLPSIQVSSNGVMGSSSALRIRGEEGFRTRILIDGVNLDDSTGPQHAPRIEHLLLADIERIEVLRGAQGMIYGADAGGVVNIITRRAGDGLRGEISHEQGRYGFEQNSAALGYGGDGFRVALHIADVDNDGFNTRTTDTVLQDDDGYENTTRSVNGAFDLGESLTLQGILRSNKSRNDYDGCFQGFSTVHDCRLDYDQFVQRYALNYAADDTRFSVAWQHSRFDRKSYVAGVLDTAFGVFEGEFSEWQLQGGRDFASGTLSGGVDLKEEVDEQNEAQRDQRAAWLEWQGDLSDGVFFTLGGRHDSSDDFGDFFSHRVTLARVIEMASGDELKVRASHGNGFRLPSLQELRTNAGAGRPQLEEEFSRGFDIGVEYHDEHGNVQLTLFRQKITNPIDYSQTLFYYVQDQGDATSDGIELSGEWAAGDWRVDANATYNETRAVDGGQRARRPRQLYNLGVSYQVPVLPLALDMQVHRVEDVVDKPFGAPRVALDDYTRVDMKATWRLTDQLDFWVRGENLLDDEYTEVLTYNAAGATVHSGFRFSLD